MNAEVSTIGQLLVILVSSSLVSNVVLSQFLGLCPFLGVSKKVKTAAGMGVAVIFVGEDLDVLLELCDRVMVITSGSVAGIFDGRNTTKEEIGLHMTKSNQEEDSNNG